MGNVANDFYTYVYLDTRKPGKFSYGLYSFDYEPFYIGKGKKGPRGQQGRILRHLTDYNLKHDTNKLKVNIIQKIKKETGKNPEIIFYQKDLTDKESIDLEILMIKGIGRRDLKTGPLCNLTDGGDTSNLSSLAREKIANAKRGIPRSESTKAQLSRFFSGKKLSEEVKLKIKIGCQKSSYWRGKKLPPATILKMSLNSHNDGLNNGHCLYVYDLISPQGDKFSGVTSLYHFCADRDLSHFSIRRAVRQNKSYKGWQVSRYPKDNYTWE